MSKIEKDMFVDSIRSVEINGAQSIPTTLFYEKNNAVIIGSEAISKSKNRFDLNEDFKVDLGNIDLSTSHKYKKFETASGDRVSAIRLTDDFFRGIFKHINKWLSENGTTNSPNILIAEPLSLQGDIVEDKWLNKYRENIKKIMGGSYFGFKNISFMPEPFAVFQYYRYGYKHPILSEQTKNNALVIDFGGGTFDVCIIETTKTGDVKKGGKNSRPLAASSVPRGGYFINRVIAENLLEKVSNKEIKKGIKQYNNWRKGNIDIDDLNENNQNFIQNFHNLIYAIEPVKINLCNKIQDWSIANISNASIPVEITKDPFSNSNETVNVSFSAKEFYDIFISSVWNPYLKSNIKCALKRGEEELNGEPITVVLLSGGSANIRWLRELIMTNFHREIGNIKIFNLTNFQEIVSQGLAIECARRFFSEDTQGDFSAVTYNRLCLVLDPNRSGVETKIFKPKTSGLPALENGPGVLIPSASVIKDFIDIPMKWRVKLKQRPSLSLDYYFLRSSTDHTDLDNIMNFVDKTVYTPPKCKFDSSIQVHLVVKENGTAVPKFIYKTGPNDTEVTSVTGIAFPIDMTCEQQSHAEAYIGFDFGTSNSSVSFVDNKAIQFYEKKSKEVGWQELSVLVDTLPYPLATTLSTYLSQIDPKKRIDNAREFIEMAFSLMGYVSYLDYCYCKGSSFSKIFKNFSKRSAGPLWKLIQESLRKHTDKSICYESLQKIMESKNHKLIDEAITKIAQHKHDKLDESSLDLNRPIQFIANVANDLFSKFHFGFFDQVQQKKFKKGTHEGIFRIAHGKPPFVNVLKYSGTEPFNNSEAMLINCEEGIVFPLSPLIFWDVCSKHQDLDAPGHCFFYDILQKGSYSFKASGATCTCEVTKENDYESIAEDLEKFIEEDQKIDLPDKAAFSGCKFQ